MITLGRARLFLPRGSTPAQRAAWRRQMASALGYADLAPRGLPPHAVLIVRRLPDPLPGLLLKGVAWRAGDRWGDAARAELERLWRRALRPALSPVPADAEAVWFADMAEYLACLTLDFYHGVAQLRWWWQLRLQAPRLRQAAAPLTAVWQDEARWLPAALAFLHEHSPVSVAAILNKLPAYEMQPIRRGVLQAHGLPQALLEETFGTPAWYAWIPNPEKLGGLAPETQATAVLVLAAYYAPAALRQYARRAPIVDRAEQVRHSPIRPGPPVIPPGEATPAVPPPARAQPLKRDTPCAVPAAARAPGTADPPRDRQTGAPASELQEHMLESQAAPSAPAPETTGATPASTPPAQARAPGVQGMTERPEGWRTALGGAWLLTNLLVALDLLQGDLSPWLKLEVLARRLLVNPPGDDPVWAVLAELQGPERTPQALALAGRWLSTVWPVIEAWLLERMEEASLTALVKPAHMYVTRAHIDVMFRIEDIDLGLRMSGLDRDPGWVPEIARVIRFHFE